MIKLPKLKPGDFCLFTFLDHSVGLHHAITCRVAGYVLEDHPDFLKCTTWLPEIDDPDAFANNLETFVVVKSTIKKARVFKSEKVDLSECYK